MRREKSSGGLSAPTLIVAALSAASAAVLVPLIWEPGTVVAAAITPVIVSLVAETVRHPVERAGSVITWRRTSGGAVVREERFDPVAGDEAVELVEGGRSEDPFGLREPERPSVVRRRRVAVALVSGLLAFAIAAVVVTASELTLFDDAVSRPSRTTFFGGRPAEATPTPTSTSTPAPTPTPSAAPEGTPGPVTSDPEATPEATITPGATLSPQPQDTPAPTATP